MFNEWVVNGTRGVAAIFMASVLIVGCGDKKEGDGKSPEKAETKTSQVAAKVNGTEITVRQIDAQMPNLPADANPEMVGEVRNAILNRLINDQLIVDKAIADKLDRKPEVVDQIERARRTILARAYIQQLVAGASAPSELEVKEFYDKSAADFSGNVRYIVRQVIVEIPPVNATAVKEQIAKATSVAELTKWLSAHDVRTIQQTNMINTAGMNPQLRDQLKTMKVKDMLRQVGDDRAMVTEILAVESFPLTQTAIKPLAEKDLNDKRQTEILENQVKQMRDTAKIEYSEGYAKPKSPEEIKALADRLDAEAKAHQAPATPVAPMDTAPVAPAPAP